jgi:phytoene dehydrogenase-like protein
MEKSIIIIGAGMGGLAAGIYGQMNGYKTQIFEMHSIPGGQCTGWKRKGYTFDVCIHHLFGCHPVSKLYNLWNELGAMPREIVYTNDCVSVVSPDGKMFHDYYDLEMLEQHLRELSPEDSRVIGDYIKAIKAASESDFWGEITMGTMGGIIKMTPRIIPLMKWFKITMQQFADRFSDPFLKSAFPLLEYSLRSMPFIVHLAKHGYGYKKAVAWPVGGSLEFARSIEQRYKALGGEVNYRQKVVKILTENNRAVGIRLADESEYRADIVISNADGRKTIMEMLEGKYTDDQTKKYCEDPQDETSFAVHVFLGVNRDLSNEPSALVMLLDEPVEIANHKNKSLDMQMYSFDRTMAPEGKGVIKVELVSTYSYWKELYSDRQRYDEEKQKVAQQAIDVLESNYFKGIKKQIEIVDVPTLMTWERYMGGTHGFANLPSNRKISITGSLTGKNLLSTLPNLSNFYFVGNWATSAGALFMNAFSGRTIVKNICKMHGKKFQVTPY